MNLKKIKKNMVRNKLIILIILILSIFLCVLSFTLPFYGHDAPERVMSAMFVVESIKGYISGDISSLSDLQENFTQRYSQYGFFPGLFEWPLLQVSIFSVLMLILGSNIFSTNILGIVLYALILYVAYVITLKLTKDKKTSALSSVLLGLHPILILSASHPTLDIGLAFMYSAIILALIYLMKNPSMKNFLLLGLLLGLAINFKYELVLIFPALILVFSYEHGSKLAQYIKKNFLKILACAGIFTLTIVPFIIVQLYLSQYGISTFMSRIDDMENPEPTVYPGFYEMTMDDLYYGCINSKNQEAFYSQVMKLNAPPINAAYAFLSMFFRLWPLIPFFIIGLFVRIKLKQKKTIDVFFASIAITYFLFFTFAVDGLRPRYLSPIILVLAFYSSIGIINFTNHFRSVLIGLVIAALLTINVLFFIPFYTGDYEGTSMYWKVTDFIISDAQGTPSTLLVTQNAIKAQALDFYRSGNDNIYVSYYPIGKENFHKQISGKNIAPQFFSDRESSPELSINRPNIKYLVYYERDICLDRYFKYDILSEISTLNNFVLVKTIGDTPNRIFIYKRVS